MGGPHEHCAFCGIETPYWFEEKDVPVCTKCAVLVSEKDVPSKQEWISQPQSPGRPRPAA